MDAERWAAIRALFDELVELGPSTRAERLDRLGVSDPGLRDEVAALLAADAEADERLDSLESSLPSAETPPDVFRLRGQTVSHFRVIEPISAGGMGMVYRGEDLRLRRPVALKFLLPQLQLDAVAKERFLHEARSAGSLDHANLCTIFAAEEDDGRLFVAMPLYAGETLKARLERRGPLPVEEAVEIARQAAEGLACAHAAGIVHRDVKPGNLMLLPDGTVKLVDFGLAKMRDLTLTGPGTMLGTAAYMAPEQIRGEEITSATDLWALGVVLYEMLTGRRPFAGEHEAAIAHAIVNEDPVHPSAIDNTIPANIQTVVVRALEKVSANRWQSAREFADALSGGSVAHLRPSRRLGWRGLHRNGTARRAIKRVVGPLLLSLAAVIGLSIAAWAWWWTPAQSRVLQNQAVAFELLPPPGSVLVQGATASLTVGGNPFAFAPDGRSFVFMAAPASGGSPRLYLRSLADPSSQLIADSENAMFPTFSPDGRSLAFLVGKELRRVSTSGGASVRIAVLDPADVWGIAWGKDAIVIGHGRSGLAIVPIAGGAVTVLTRPDTTDGSHAWPIVLPDGETVLFKAGGSLRNSRVGIAWLSSGRSIVMDLVGLPLAFIDGILVFHDGDHSLFGVPLDLEAVRTLDSPMLLADDVAIGRAGAIKATLSANGSLVYLSSSGLTAPRELVSVAPTGGELRLLSNRPFLAVRQAPDGRRLALTIVAASSQETWLLDGQSGTLQPLHVRPGYRPEWSPDGRNLLLFKSGGIWRVPVNGTDAGELLVPAAEYAVYTPDGRSIVYRTSSTNQLWVRSVDGDTTSRPVAAASGIERGNPAVSRDGRWLAYPSNEAGAWHIYLQPFAGSGPRYAVSADGGDNVVWAPDGRRLYYSFGGQIIEATITFAPTYRVSRRVVFTNVEEHSLYRPWDVTRDGSLLTTRAAGPNPTSRVFVVHNWAAEMRRRIEAR